MEGDIAVLCPPKDKAGPLLLLILLAGAFLPSVFIEFDIQGLLAALQKAGDGSFAPALVFLPAADSLGSTSPDAEVLAGLQVSTGASESMPAFLAPEAPRAFCPDPSPAWSRLWPPGIAQSPRAPPPAPVMTGL